MNITKGLGLSIVENRVKMMEGKVGIADSAGYGTTVTFQLMVGVDDGANSPAKQPVDEGGCSSISPLRVLVVEDEKINAMVISAMLRKIGHFVYLATNGRQALKMVREGDFDCIFMDIQMPEMDGVETTQAIRSMTPNLRKVPIIALTAHAMAGDKERFIAAGMDDYLTKPVEIGSLLEVLRKIYRSA